MMKLLLKLILFVFILSTQPSYSQDDSFRRDRKRTWRKWRKNKQSYNPYLERKAKNKPSAIAARQNKRDMRRAEKRNRKQMRRSRRKVNK